MNAAPDPVSPPSEAPEGDRAQATADAALSSRLQERGIPSVNRVCSIQSRVTSALAVGFVCLMSAGLLTWYYAHALHPAEPDHRLRPKTNARAQTEVGLPPLGHFEPPHVATAAPSTIPPPPDASLMAQLLGAPPSDPGAVANSIPPPTGPVAPRASHFKRTFAQVALDRRLSGAVRSSAEASPPSAPSSPAPSTSAQGTGEEPSIASGNALLRSAASAGLESGTPESNASSVQADPTRVRALLTTDVVPAVKARVLPTQRFLLPQGAFIDCTLETAIDSTLPGMTTCVTATDTFGADGQVVLLERGTKLVGETRGQVQQGQSRVFVLWTQARTPTGVVIPLASPGTDELGRAGLPGQVDRHFWDRFGAALLITVVDGAIERAATPRSNGGIVTVNPSASESVLTEILRNTLNIPPTVRKDQGDRLQILVARDVDFRSVYDLRLSPHSAP
jgi:type IV secretion system protein VirB10